MTYTDNSEVIRNLESRLARMYQQFTEVEEENELLREVYEDARYFLRYTGVDKIRGDSGYRHLINSVEAVKLRDSSNDS